MVFQHFGLLPHRDLVDNVAFGLEVQGIGKDVRRARAEDMLELVGLAGLGSVRPDQLSGGMQQRVGLARALATGPEVLLFDEPFSALDPVIRRDMQDEIVRLRGKVATTMVFITHDLVEALRLGDRIAIMRDGRFVQVGTPAEVVGQPADDDVRAFVRDVARSHVVPVESVMAPPDGAVDRLVTRVPVGTKVRDVLADLARSDRPVGVVDDGGTLVGDGRPVHGAARRRRSGLMALATVAVAPAPSRDVATIARRLVVPVAVIAAICVVGALIGPDVPGWLDAHLVPAVDDLYDWTVRNNDRHWLFTWMFQPISDALGWATEAVLSVLRGLRWPGVLTLVGLIGWRTGGTRAAVTGCSPLPAAACSGSGTTPWSRSR